MLLIIDASNISSICCIDAPVVSQGVLSLLNASAGISTEIETSCNVLQVRMYECAQVLQSAGQMIDAVQTVTRTVTSSVWQTTHLLQNDVVNNPLISQTLSGSTTTDESAASASRLQSAATQQDLQSAATAPQLTTTQDPYQPRIQQSQPRWDTPRTRSNPPRHWSQAKLRGLVASLPDQL